MLFADAAIASRINRVCTEPKLIIPFLSLEEDEKPNLGFPDLHRL